MKAISVNEVQNFERGIDPKASMKIGKQRFKDFEDYVEQKCKKHKLDSDDFWNEWNDMKASSCDTNDLIEDLQEAIRNTPIDYQIQWISDDLNQWLEDQI